jgi:hypothetical protein
MGGMRALSIRPTAVASSARRHCSISSPQILRGIKTIEFPTLNLVTLSPTATTRPMISWPGTQEYAVRTPLLPLVAQLVMHRSITGPD